MRQPAVYLRTELRSIFCLTLPDQAGPGLQPAIYLCYLDRVARKSSARLSENGDAFADLL